MELGFSLYLEFVRFGAALLVLFGHIMGESPAINKLFGSWQIDHDGVVIFFVLSGYVIAYVSATKEQKLYSFAVNRMARIYSVALPTLVLGLIIELAYWHFSKGILGPLDLNQKNITIGHEFHVVIKTFIYSLFFLNELHWRSSWAFCIGPYWSLCYEVWYYILFGAFFYSSGWPRWIYSSVIALIMGIKILLLFPVWLLGVAIYHLHRRIRLSQQCAWGIWLASFLIYIILKHFNASIIQSVVLLSFQIVKHYHHSLIMSNFFAWDYLLGILVAANIFSYHYMTIPLLTNKFVSRIVKYCASYTFSLYLYQMPLVMAWYMMPWALPMKHVLPNYMRIILYVTFILAGVILLGRVTEHKKQFFRNWIIVGFSYLQRMGNKKIIVDCQSV